MSTNGTRLRKANGSEYNLMGRHSGAFLLSHGDALQINSRYSLLFHFCPCSIVKPELSDVELAEAKAFRGQYELTTRKIGSGGNGSVYIALRSRNGRQVACKTVRIQGTARRNVQKSFREFEVLKSLCHPNIIALEKVFYSATTIYIFQELITGGDLFSYIESKDNGRIPDFEAALIVRQILKAVEYLHDRNIVHRDLKPDNILMVSLGQAPRIVLTDFGSARSLAEGSSSSPSEKLKSRMKSIVGTVEFAAPEMYNKNPAISDQGYSKAVDMWAVGVITTAMLGGESFFTDRTRPDWEDNYADIVLSLASKCDLSALDAGDWRHVGTKPKDFIKKLLILDEDARMTAKQALRHPWFTQGKRNSELEQLFDKAYARILEGWRPPRQSYPVIEELNAQKGTPLQDTSPFFSRRVSQMSLSSSRSRTETPLDPISETDAAQSPLQSSPNVFLKPPESADNNSHTTVPSGLEHSISQDMHLLDISHDDPSEKIDPTDAPMPDYHRHERIVMETPEPFVSPSLASEDHDMVMEYIYGRKRKYDDANLNTQESGEARSERISHYLATTACTREISMSL